MERRWSDGGGMGGRRGGWRVEWSDGRTEERMGGQTNADGRMGGRKDVRKNDERFIDIKCVHCKKLP